MKVAERKHPGRSKFFLPRSAHTSRRIIYFVLRAKVFVIISEVVYSGNRYVGTLPLTSFVFFFSCPFFSRAYICMYVCMYVYLHHTMMRVRVCMKRAWARGQFIKTNFSTHGRTPGYTLSSVIITLWARDTGRIVADKPRKRSYTALVILLYEKRPTLETFFKSSLLSLS